MTYRKSKSGAEFVMIRGNGSALAIKFYNSFDGSPVQVKASPLSCDVVARQFVGLVDDTFIDCTQREFEEAYTRAIKLIKL